MTDKDTATANRCFICGYDNPHGLHEHHIVPREYSGSDLPENLTWLCASCHEAIHKLYDDRFYERLGVRAETSETSPLDMDMDGESVDPEVSMDRPIPKSSPHVQFDFDHLHCGYCHTVFSKDKHSNMARHLRITHGIENPYYDGFEEVDNPSEGMRTKHIHPEMDQSNVQFGGEGSSGENQ